ncbi:MAG: TetR/AcrR family transcriptional regulator [Oscillospiraceae bacterium]|nr:TetR/AcrR family transcriptional regulator [Oscillospiraceae bacterium]
MAINQELKELQKEVTRNRILETGFRVFAEKAIDKVTMNDVAEAAGVGVATVYRYFSTKPALVLGVHTWAWERYLRQTIGRMGTEELPPAAAYEFFLDAFLDLYRNHRDLLRFNQFFNVWVEHEALPREILRPFISLAEELGKRIHRVYVRGLEDGTFRADTPERELYFSTLHLMLAAVTRYAVGLVYEGGADPEQELLLLKKMLLREFTANENLHKQEK